ncbi:hypothetical protein COLSTE_02435 [Collinsella stercoris DSM 13279]|uniref:Uncharacterized protein n=1 Tax=Collinsella stercoris DSM 13279 TaxID=445975 RepID=B6GE98_9ACTN|nr:hypothetical protein COLSTE_02435 [Collinsella stercoris DSM 13279]
MRCSSVVSDARCTTGAVMAQSGLCRLRGAATGGVIHDAPPSMSRPRPSGRIAG